jgi:hypothetical protein
MMRLIKIDTSKQLADIFTKPMAYAQFIGFVRGILGDPDAMRHNKVHALPIPVLPSAASLRCGSVCRICPTQLADGTMLTGHLPIPSIRTRVQSLTLTLNSLITPLPRPKKLLPRPSTFQHCAMCLHSSERGLIGNKILFSNSAA